MKKVQLISASAALLIGTSLVSVPVHAAGLISEVRAAMTEHSGTGATPVSATSHGRAEDGKHKGSSAGEDGHARGSHDGRGHDAKGDDASEGADDSGDDHEDGHDSGSDGDDGGSDGHDSGHDGGSDGHDSGEGSDD